MMQTYDLVMLIVLVGTTLIGAWRGMARQIASLASIFLSYFVAIQFRDVLAPKISAAPPWNVFLAMLILYVGTSLIIWIAFRLVSDFLDQMKLQGFDRQLGAVVGAAKGAILCIVITFFAVSLLGDDMRVEIVNSRSGMFIAQFLDRSDTLIPVELHHVLRPYLERFDERFQTADPTRPTSREGEVFAPAVDLLPPQVDQWQRASSQDSESRF